LVILGVPHGKAGRVASASDLLKGLVPKRARSRLDRSAFRWHLDACREKRSTERTRKRGYLLNLGSRCGAQAVIDRGD
jgi:hypothetical protein